VKPLSQSALSSETSNPKTTLNKRTEITMNKYLLSFLTILSLFVSTAFAGKATVVLRKRSCDYFLVQTTTGDYSLLEWMSGYDPEKGDAIVGDFNTFGSQDMYCTTSDEEVSVYVEDYMMSKTSALEQFYEQCEE
jgi:hypothetical protein